MLADLILLSDSGLLTVLFPGGPRTTLAYLASRPGNPFSYEHGLVVELKGEVLGAAIGSTTTSLNNEKLSTALLIVRHYGLRFPAKLVRLARANAATDGLNEGDFYLSNLAVFPRAQGLGHGTRLLRSLERRLRETGLGRVILDVDPSNERAALFYAALGYREESRVSFSVDRASRFEYRRLWKPLSPEEQGAPQPTRRAPK